MNDKEKDTVKAKEAEFRALYDMKNSILGSRYNSVRPMKFYRDLFPEGSFERKGHKEDGKPNGIIINLDSRKSGKPWVSRSFVHDDLGTLAEHRGKREVIVSAVGYWGLRRTNENARELHAFVFDLDGVGQKQMKNLEIHFSIKHEHGGLARPTYIVNSGGGLHLYYILEKPLTMRPQDILRYNILKKLMTERIWSTDTSTYEKRQIQGVTQGFRMVGSQTKTVPNEPLVAYKTGSKYADLKSVEDAFLWNDYQRSKYTKYKTTVPLLKAKEKWPKWYQKRIVESKEIEKKGQWLCNSALYEWFFNKLNTESPMVGHRYFRIMCLTSYAIKCGISFDKLEKDAYSLVEKFDTETANPFTVADVRAALKLYKDSYATFPRDVIATLSAFDMPANKRNGRTRVQNLRIARVAQAEDYPNGEWRKGNGRHSKQKEVREYRLKHPNENNKSKIARELGVSRVTVTKHWNENS
jgi:hypothetical protein